MYTPHWRLAFSYHQVQSLLLSLLFSYNIVSNNIFSSLITSYLLLYNLLFSCHQVGHSRRTVLLTSTLSFIKAQGWDNDPMYANLPEISPETNTELHRCSIVHTHTIPCFVFKSSPKDLSFPVFEIKIQSSSLNLMVLGRTHVTHSWLQYFKCITFRYFFIKCFFVRCYGDSHNWLP